MSNLIEFLIPKVQAQSADAISQPTFGAITSGVGQTTSASILLNWDNPTVRVGNTFKVRVELRTGDFRISEYRAVITYDRDFLSVVDKDPATPGTQVTMLDTLLTIQTPASDNLAADGRIVVSAEAPSGSDYQINKEVIEIEFQAQRLGQTKVQVATAVDGSRLNRLSGQSIAYTVNEVNVNIAAATAVTPQPQPTPNPVTPTPAPTQPVAQPPVTTIPNTAIGDGPSVMLSLGLGIGLIFTGFSLFIGKLKRSRN